MASTTGPYVGLRRRSSTAADVIRCVDYFCRFTLSNIALISVMFL